MTSVDSVMSIVLLSASIWSVGFLLPKARREHDAFAFICSLLTALVSFLGWLLLGVGTYSR